MRILGIGLSHCAGVCLIEDDRIVFAQEEERFSRRRRQKGWPALSLEHLFRHYRLKESDIDLCVVCDLQAAERLPEPIRALRAKRTIAVHHHLAHVMSGWALSPWDDFEAVSLDGGGDYAAWLSFAAVRGRALQHWESNCGAQLDAPRRRVVRGLLHRRAPGRPFGTYWSMPAVVNFGMVDHHGIAGYEGKLMGLAAHGQAGRFASHGLRYDGSFATVRRGRWTWLTTHGHPKIGDPEHCVTPDGRRVPLAEVRRLRKQEQRIVCEYDLERPDHRQIAADFAAQLQRQTDEALLRCVAENFEPGSRVVVSGGTFANVLSNGLLNRDYRLFVTPPMGDEGLALGAAAWGAYVSGIERLQPTTLYLGFDAGRNPDVDPEEVGERLANREVVGLIDGPMELGPRALGARTILADPQDADANQTINERLGRVEYMPFAPVILQEFAGEVLRGWLPDHASARHMTLVYQVHPAWRERLAGVVHVDGTVRPQVLGEAEHPFYHAIVRAYWKRTGIPVLINTSFNAHGEPMVRTAEDGLRALAEGRVDALVAGNKVTSSNKQQATSNSMAKP